MAGPFSSTGVQDIPDVQLSGGFTPSDGIAGAVNAGLQVALPQIRENRIQNLKEDVSGQTKDIETFLKLARTPSLLKSEFGVEAIENPAVRSAFAEFVKVRDASDQGKLPQQFALERLAVIQNTAISNAPEFEREIRAAMQQATGQDPQKTIFNQLLSTQTQELSPEQKGLNQLRKDAAENGLSVEQQQEVNHSVAISTLEKNKLDRKKAQGTYSLLDASSETNNRAGSIMLDTMAAIRQELQRSGSLSPEFSAQIGIQSKTNIATAIAQITAGAKNVDGTQIANAIAPLEKLQEQIDGMLEDGSMQALVSSNNTLNKSILEEGIMQMPEFAAAWTFGGPRGFVDMLKFMEKAPDASSQALLGQLSPSAKTAFTLRNLTADTIAREYGRLGTGIQPVTDVEKNARVVAASIAMGTSGLEEEKQIVALNEMRAIDEELAWASFGSRKVLTATTQSKSLQSALINMQATQTAGLATEYLELSVTPGVDIARFEFLGSRLSYKRDTAELKGVNAENTAEATAFAARFNRANNISASHMKAGTLPAIRYSGTADYWEVVTKAGREAFAVKDEPAQEQAPTVIEWGVDDSGKPIRLTK